MSAPHRLNLTRLGWGLAVPILFLSLVGMAAIHASDRSVKRGDDASGHVPLADVNWVGKARDAIGQLTLRQALYLLSGAGLMFAVTRPSYRRIGERAYLIYWAVVALLVMLVVDKYGLIDFPFIARQNNTFRWINLRLFSIQPSEFMKLALVLALARYLRFRKSFRTWPGLIPPFLLTLLPMALILKQPDLGTLLMLLPVLFAMLFVAGARLWHLATIVGLGLATLPLFYYSGMEDYQKKRIQIVFRQNTADERWQRSFGYQLRQSKIALGMGRVAGQGYREGVFVEYELLPEQQNDFIFAIVGNQWGLVGCLLVILAYVVIVVCGLEVALVTNDPFGRLLAVGIVVMIVAQALLNICMTMGLAPITGMPLPFVSAGGSSAWANFLAMGLLVNVAQRRPMLIGRPPFKHEEEA